MVTGSGKVFSYLSGDSNPPKTTFRQVVLGTSPGYSPAILIINCTININNRFIAGVRFRRMRTEKKLRYDQK